MLGDLSKSVPALYSRLKRQPSRMHPQNTHTPCHELDLVPNSTFELSGMLKTKLASERTTDEARKEAGAYPFVSSHSTSGK